MTTTHAPVTADTLMARCPLCKGKGVRPLAHTGTAMREWREAQGVPMADVARRMGVTRSYVCNLEQDRTAWSRDALGAYIAAVSTA